AVAAAPDGETVKVGHGLGHGTRARRETLVLEHAHGPVPEDGAGAGDLVDELGSAAGPDVEAAPALRHIPPHGAHAVALGLGRHHVARQEHALLPGKQAPAVLDLIGLEERVAHLVTH